MRRLGLVLAVPALVLLASAWELATPESGPDIDPSSTPTSAPGSGAAPAPSSAEVRPDVRSGGLTFVDITRKAGIDFVHENGAAGGKLMPETLSGGGGFLDYDGDGLPDLLLVNGARWPGQVASSPPPRTTLYRNLGEGRFEDVSTEVGLDLTAYGQGFAAADYDADGDPDVFLTVLGENRLLRNDEGLFVDVTSNARLSGSAPGAEGAPGWSTAAQWLDFDRDGWLDLFVCNYLRWTPDTDVWSSRDGRTKAYAMPEQYDGERCYLYRGRGDGTFEDIGEAAGVAGHVGRALGIAMEDLNDDGWPDVLIANDLMPNFLFLNQGDGTFREEASRFGVAVDGQGAARAGMGIDVADVAGHGRLSVAIGNFRYEAVSLYTQQGPEHFEDLASAAGLAEPTVDLLTFGVLFGDFDSDGFQDLVLANGHVEPTIADHDLGSAFELPPQFFHNTGRGRFEELTEVVGSDFATPTVGRAVASADIDLDGDLDLLITVNGGRPRLLRNDLRTGAHWLRIRLRGAFPNRDALGGVVTVFAGGRRQRRMVRTGSSYLSQSETNPVMFGLGALTQADSVHVRWPTSGLVQRVGPMEADRTHEVVEAPLQP